MSASPAQIAPGRERLGLIAPIGLLLAVSAMSVDIMLVGLPRLADEFGVTAAQAQWVVLAFMFGFAAPFVAIGAVSDDLGRKRVLLCGLGLYLLAAAWAARAGSFEELIAARALQGAGAAVAPSVGLAVLRDVYAGQQLARAMAIAMAFFAIGPVAAPPIGALLLSVGPWPLLFWLQFAAVAALGLWIGLWFPETAPGPRARPQIARSLTAARRAFGHPVSRPIVFAMCFVRGALTGFLVGAPTAFIVHFGWSETAFGLLFGVLSLTIVASQAFNARALRTICAQKMFRGALWTQLAPLAIGIALCASLSDVQWWLPAVLAVFAVGMNIALANGAALALAPHDAVAGAASGVFGFVQISAGAILGWAIGLAADHSVQGLLIGMALCVVAALFASRARVLTTS